MNAPDFTPAATLSPFQTAVLVALRTLHRLGWPGHAGRVITCAVVHLLPLGPGEDTAALAAARALADLIDRGLVAADAQDGTFHLTDEGWDTIGSYPAPA